MRAAWFFSPVDVDAENDEINENTGEFKPTEIMRAMYDELLEIALCWTSFDRVATMTPMASPNQRVQSYVLRTPSYPCATTDVRRCFLLHKASGLQWNGLRRVIYRPLV